MKITQQRLKQIIQEELLREIDDLDSLVGSNLSSPQMERITTDVAMLEAEGMPVLRKLESMLGGGVTVHMIYGWDASAYTTLDELLDNHLGDEYDEDGDDLGQDPREIESVLEDAMPVATLTIGDAPSDDYNDEIASVAVSRGYRAGPEVPGKLWARTADSKATEFKWKEFRNAVMAAKTWKDLPEAFHNIPAIGGGLA